MAQLALLFGFDRRVDRRTYLLVGVSLMALKYALEVIVVRATSGQWLTPPSFLSPLLSTRAEAVSHSPAGLAALALIALPCMWIGVSMSARRALDAGRSPFLGLLFFVPVLHFLLIAALAILPSRLEDAAVGVGYRARPKPPEEGLPPSFRSAVLGTVAGLAIGLGMTLLSVVALRAYGAALFFGTPLVMGAVAAYFHNKDEERSVGSTVLVGVLTVVIAGGAMLLFALEGALCIAMAAPPALFLAFFGALFGRAFATRGRRPGWAGGASMLVLLPLTAGVEAKLTEAPLRAVTTATAIAAPPARVWENVVGFSDLPPPSEWEFRTGIAYPMRATIDGRGVGAVRKCEFSTGPFVEPITTWDAPRHLAFDVSAQPPSLKEWSPWRTVHAPHVTGYMRSRRGEFRLTDRGDGTTLLEGTTWYTLDVFPGAYWTLWSDWLLHEIHGRVLAHIKNLSEAQPTARR